MLEKCGEIANMDIPMLGPQHSEMTGRKFHTFSCGGRGHLNLQAKVAYPSTYVGFTQALSSLSRLKLTWKGEERQATACSGRFLLMPNPSGASLKKQQREGQRRQELEEQRR